MIDVHLWRTVCHERQNGSAFHVSQDMGPVSNDVQLSQEHVLCLHNGIVKGWKENNIPAFTAMQMELDAIIEKKRRLTSLHSYGS